MMFMEVIVVIMIETNTKTYITNWMITDQCDQEDEQTYQIIVKEDLIDHPGRGPIKILLHYPRFSWQTCLSQILYKYWDRILIEYWSNTYQILIKYWDKILIKYSSNTESRFDNITLILSPFLHIDHVSYFQVI